MPASGPEIRLDKETRKRMMTYSGCMGKFIGIRTGAVVEKDEQVEGLGGLVQVEEATRRAAPI